MGKIPKKEPTVVPRLVLTDDFLSSMAELDGVSMTMVVQFLRKFMRDPRSSGINYERLQGAKDKKVHSARINQAHRAIVIAPEEGDESLAGLRRPRRESLPMGASKEF